MESRSKNSESEDPAENVGSRRLARSVIVQAIRDLGSASVPSEIINSRLWRKTEAYRRICEISQWDPEWLDNLFEAIENLWTKDASLRREIASQCVALLKKVGRVKDS